MKVIKKSKLYQTKSQLISIGKARVTCLFTATGRTSFIYIMREVVLMYFTDKNRINAFDTRTEASDWLELSKCARVRTTVILMAEQRIAWLPAGPNYPPKINSVSNT